MTYSKASKRDSIFEDHYCHVGPHQPRGEDREGQREREYEEERYIRYVVVRNVISSITRQGSEVVAVLRRERESVCVCV